MFKRLTDTDKWKKNVWFRKLPKDYKLLWLYVNDDCDNVGVWEVDLELANILMGTECELEKASEIFKKRIYEFTTGNDTLKWFVKNFCDFQYSGKNKSFNPTSPANIPQQSYVELLKRHGLLDLAIIISKGDHSLSIPYAKGTRTHIDNDIEDDKVFPPLLPTIRDMSVGFPASSKEYTLPVKNSYSSTSVISLSLSPNPPSSS